MSTTNPSEVGRLLVGLCRLHHTRAHQCMEQVGLFRGQGILLMTLSEQDGVSHSELADKLKITPAAATHVIKRMEETGYVQRRADPSDDRVSRVFLTAKGRAQIAQAEREFDRLDRATLDGLSERDLERLRDVFVRMQANLERFQP